MAQIIAIINHKGGTGKTTTTVNLGAALTKKGKKVLLIDLDPQGSLTYHLGIKGPSFNIANVLLKEAKISDIMHEREGMMIVTANSSLSDIELTIGHQANRETFLKNAIEEILPQFDYILIDCSPAISVLTINALTVAKKVIIPVKLEMMSLEGVRLVAATVEKVRSVFNPLLSVMGALPVMYNRNSNLLFGKSKAQKQNDNVLKILKTDLQIPVFKTTISADVLAMQAPSQGISLFKFAPKSKLVKEYELLSNEFLSKM
jgi:chromosome partitioning protein